ncbi:MAG: hypothetical protein HKP41_02110, partial [Desulfobacterales bacterium]|nr:hypothetical protein [Desulfobacterales bacterium]
MNMRYYGNSGVLLIFAFCFVTIPDFAEAGTNPWEKKLPFESASIHYELSGMETGQEVLYIKDFGSETARHRTTSISVLGMKKENKTVEIVSPDWFFTFDLQEGTGSKSVNPQKILIDEYNKLSDAEKKTVRANAEKMGTSALGGMQGSVEQNAKKILGYSCDKVIIAGTSMYYIHDTSISLLSETKMMGVTVRSEATYIEISSVADTYFSFPQGIVPKPSLESDQVANMMAKQTIAILKDPEGFEKDNQGSIMGFPTDQQNTISPEEQLQVEGA